jgi:hypothetical protein
MATQKQIEANRAKARKGGLARRGKKNKKTLDKEISLERIRQRVFAMSDKLVDAQAVIALGTWKMLRPFIGEDGLPHTETIRDMDAMQDLIDNGIHGKDYLIVAGTEPDHKAADALLNRAYGKPTETLDLGNKDDEPFIIELDD